MHCLQLLMSCHLPALTSLRNHRPFGSQDRKFHESKTDTAGRIPA